MKFKGEITVFLSLSFIVLLTFILALLELTNLQISNVYSERAFNDSISSSFGRYFYPLFKDYHIFSLYNENIENNVKESIEYIFEPTKNLNTDYNNKILDIDIKNIQLVKKVGLLDYDNKIVKNQILEFMKYDFNDDILTEIFTNLNLIKSTNNYIEFAKKEQNFQDENIDKESKKELNKTVVKQSPIKNLKKLLKTNLMELVIEDINTISQNKISSNNISVDDKYINIGKSICKSKVGYNLDLIKSLESFLSIFNNSNIDDTNAIQTLLIDKYIQQHFNYYTKEDIIQDTNLKYEIEYILEGYDIDSKNIEKIIQKLLLIRTILNYIYLLNDNEKNDLAYITAITIAGATCIEPIIKLTKNLILFVWSFDEALIDVRGLLNGKQIPIMKTKDTFLIRYDELFQINKELIKYKESKILSNGLNYEEYLKILLFVQDENTKFHRFLNLIQENIRKNYDKNFLLEDCIYGIRIKLNLELNNRFFKLNNDKFKLELEREYCY